MATLLLALIYLAFISLGLPDAMLGAAWPVMQAGFGVAYGLAGLAQALVAGGTIISSVVSSRVLGRYGTGRVTAVSVALTALALGGFSLAPSFWWLLPLAIPLGLGAGSVDAGLNAFVAAHYESRHMSWLHSFWGIGALSGPLVLSALLAKGLPWRQGYLAIGGLQACLVLVLVLALPLWRKVEGEELVKAELAPHGTHPSVGLLAPLAIPGVGAALLAFMAYCGVEATMGLWGGSFLFKAKGLSASEAATWVSVFYGSITAGRFLTGFLTARRGNDDLIRAGILVILGGTALILAPLPLAWTLGGFILVGLGCAPIFPCMLHETPVRFGADQARAVMGFQMATAYVGSTFLPPLFGLVAGATGLGLLPWFVLGYAAVLLLATSRLRRRARTAPRMTRTTAR